MPTLPRKVGRRADPVVPEVRDIPRGPSARESAALDAAETAQRDRKRLKPPKGYRLIDHGPSFSYFRPEK